MKKLISLFVPLMALFLTLAPQRMWADEPNFFTITNNHASTATSVSMQRNNSSNSPKPTMYYRIFNSAGEQTSPASGWSSKQITGTSAVSLGSVPAGGKMQIYGTIAITTGSSTNIYYNKFVISGGTPVVSGNILSLTDYDETNEEIKTKDIWPNYYFAQLFDGCSALVSAEDLEMPATELGQYTCNKMFNSCSGLISPPKVLPATTISNNCYYGMFWSCAKLEKSPAIYATNVTTSGRYNMFNGCKALKTIRVNHTDWTGTPVPSNPFKQWVTSVPTSGTGLKFYCPPTLPRTINANDNIPSSSWTIYSYNITLQMTGEVHGRMVQVPTSILLG